MLALSSGGDKFSIRGVLFVLVVTFAPLSFGRAHLPGHFAILFTPLHATDRGRKEAKPRTAFQDRVKDHSKGIEE